MPSAEQIYTVQVIWDETMADTSAKWLSAHAGGHLVILAGNGHCHDSAIVGRLKRRGVTDAVSVRVVVDDGDKLHLATHCGNTALAAGLKAGDLLRDLVALAGGKGGGKPDQARGAAPQREKLAEILAAAAGVIKG